MNGHMTHVKMIDGREFDIPDIWIAGFCQGARLRGEPSGVEDAIYYWVWQAELADAEGVAS